MAALSHRFELFAPDLRGFGETTKPYPGPTEASLDTMSEPSSPRSSHGVIQSD